MWFPLSFVCSIIIIIVVVIVIIIIIAIIIIIIIVIIIVSKLLHVIVCAFETWTLYLRHTFVTNSGRQHAKHLAMIRPSQSGFAPAARDKTQSSIAS